MKNNQERREDDETTSSQSLNVLLNTCSSPATVPTVMELDDVGSNLVTVSPFTSFVCESPMARVHMACGFCSILCW